MSFVFVCLKHSKLCYGAISPDQQAARLLDSSSALLYKMRLNFENYPSCPMTGNKENFFDYTKITSLRTDGRWFAYAAHIDAPVLN